MKTPIKLKTCWEGILNFTTFDKKPRSVARLLNLGTTSDISGIRLWKGIRQLALDYGKPSGLPLPHLSSAMN